LTGTASSNGSVGRFIIVPFFRRHPCAILPRSTKEKHQGSAQRVGRGFRGASVFAEGQAVQRTAGQAITIRLSGNAGKPLVARLPGDPSQRHDPGKAVRTGISKATAVGCARQRAHGCGIHQTPAFGASPRCRWVRTHEFTLQGRCPVNPRPSVRPGTARRLCFPARQGNHRSRRPWNKTRRRSDEIFGLLGLFVFAIASLFAFGHSSSPDMRAFARTSARRRGGRS
jgi:hypothetical protein